MNFVPGQELCREAVEATKEALEYLRAKQDFPQKNKRVPASSGIQSFPPNCVIPAGDSATNYVGTLGNIDFLSHHNWASKAELETSATFWFARSNLELGMIAEGQEAPSNFLC